MAIYWAKHHYDEDFFFWGGESADPIESTFYVSPAYEVRRTPEGADTVKYIFASNQRVAQITTSKPLNGVPKESETLYIHKDHLGSTTVVTDKKGARKETYGEQELAQYRPFGLPRAGSDPSPSSIFRLSCSFLVSQNLSTVRQDAQSYPVSDDRLHIFVYG